MRRALLSLPFVLAASMVALPVPDVSAESINAGGRKAEANAPFTAIPVAEFDTPWAIAFLPDGRLLLTEKGGKIFIVTQSGDKTAVAGVPEVAFGGQNGLLDIAPAPDFEKARQSTFPITNRRRMAAASFWRALCWTRVTAR